MLPHGKGESKMLTLIFLVLMLAVFGKLLLLSMKAAWGITKILFTLVFLPIGLLLLVFGGMIYLALPILVIIGIVTLVKGASS